MSTSSPLMFFFLFPMTHLFLYCVYTNWTGYSSLVKYKYFSFLAVWWRTQTILSYSTVMQSKTLSVKHCLVKSNGFLASSTRSPMFQQTWWQCAPALFLASASASESFWTWWEQSVFPGVGGWLKCVGRNATADQSCFCRWSGAEMSDQPAERVCMCVGAECLVAMLLTSLWSSTTLSNVSIVLRMPIAVTALSSPPSSSGPVWITWLNVIACQRENKYTVMIVSVDFKYSNILPCIDSFSPH